MQIIMEKNTQGTGEYAETLQHAPLIEEERGKRRRQDRPRLSDAELQDEYNYILAENFTKKLLEMGLVSEGEFNKIMAKNRESFSPFFARI